MKRINKIDFISFSEVGEDLDMEGRVQISSPMINLNFRYLSVLCCFFVCFFFVCFFVLFLFCCCLCLFVFCCCCCCCFFCFFFFFFFFVCFFLFWGGHFSQHAIFRHISQVTSVQNQRLKSCADPDPPPLKNHKVLVFLRNTLQIYQASTQYLAIIGPPAKRHINGVSLAGRR